MPNEDDQVVPVEIQARAPAQPQAGPYQIGL
jgi:hypothetical protein